MYLPEFRVSQAEVFRRWMEEEDTDAGWLLNQLRSDQPSEAMLRGTAFHKALEVAKHSTIESVTSDGYTFLFDADMVLPLVETREIRLRKNYGGIVISGQVDCVAGNLIIDHKTTSQFDAERYNRGYQWRYYLDIFHANCFRWNVFEMHQEDPCVYRVTALHVMEQWRYPELEYDCRHLAHQLRDFANAYLKPALVTGDVA